MSKFNHYAVKADKIAKEAITELANAERKLKDAEALVRQYPQQTGGRIVDADYLAHSARAVADLADAKNRLSRSKAAMSDTSRQLQTIRRELSEALEREYCADPAAVDTATLELMKSGILKPAEFARLMDSARKTGNTTMMRLVAHHASLAADRADSEPMGDRKAAELRAVAIAADDDDIVGSKLAAYNVIVEAFERSISNTAMIPSWDELTGPVIEAF